MKDRKDEWTGSWCEGKLNEVEEVGRIVLDSTNFLNISLKDIGVVKIATTAERRITKRRLKELIGSREIDFVLNVKPKNPYITKKALEFAARNEFGLGGLGDAIRALKSGVITTYLNPTVEFIIRGLRQHSKVSSFVRLDNRRFEIERKNLHSVKIIYLDEYEITAESVRNAIDVFGEFDAILRSHPYGVMSPISIVVAKSLDIEIFNWNELFSELNRKWS